jgi:uncharacterized protein YkwD
VIGRTVAILVTFAIVALGIGFVATASAGAHATHAITADTNQIRQDHDLRKLGNRKHLRVVARRWAKHMARTGVLEHNPDLAKQVPNFSRLGENVAYGPDWKSVQAAFMGSPPHKAAILGDYHRFGVGSARDSDGLLWVSVVFKSGVNQ